MGWFMGSKKQEHSVDLLDGEETEATGQLVMPSMRKALGRASASAKLSGKVDEFCWQYVENFGNGLAAYKAVNPDVTAASAKVRASKLLTLDNVKARIAELRAARNSRHALLQDRVIDYHEKVMSVNRLELLDRTGCVDLSMLPEGAADILEVEQVSSKDGVRTLIKVPTRHQSAVELGRILGMHKDKVELTGKNGGPVESVTASAADELAKLAELRERFNRHGSAS